MATFGEPFEHANFTTTQESLKMRKTVALFLFAVVAVAGNAFAGAEGRMTGKVRDAVTKAPVPNVTITVVSTGARNFKSDFKGDKNGEFRFLLIDATLSYQMTWAAPGYQPYTESLKIKIGDTMAKDVVLTPVGAATVATPAAAAQPAAAPKTNPAIDAYNAGAQLFNEGKHAEAVVKFEEAVAAKPDLIAGWSALAKIYLMQKDYSKAIARANKVIELDPEETTMFAVLNQAYTATGDKAKAEEARKKMPQDAGSLFNDAAKLINSGKDKEAEVLLKQAVEVNDKFAPAYYELGMLYARSSKNADARTNLNKYLELEPNGKDAGTARDMLKFVK
jgi:tetratricopeptide (TPR) repeat protein